MMEVVERQQQFPRVCLELWVFVRHDIDVQYHV